MTRLAFRLTGVLLVLIGGCRLEKIDPAATASLPSALGSFDNKSFDPNGQVAAMWDSKVIPAVRGRAEDFNKLRDAMRANLDTAGQQHGHRERGEGAPWSMTTWVKGKVVSVDTGSSVGKIGVDVDGDGKADVLVQIGPVLRGTSLRDSLAFVSFTQYTNQIEYAQLANAFNQRAFDTALKGLPRDRLQGRAVWVLGTFATTGDDDEPPQVTPVEIRLEDGK
jgi:predicted lipoprotein